MGEVPLYVYSIHSRLGPRLRHTQVLTSPYYRGSSNSRTHTVLGPYGRSIRTFLRAVRALTFE